MKDCGEKKSVMHLSRKATRQMLVIGLTLALGCALLPVHNRILQAGTITGAALAWVGLLRLAAGREWLGRILLVSPLLALPPFLLPGKPINPEALRMDYVSRMRGFDGTRYVWGGESPLGIDCSGLPRRALRDALWSEGWHHANGTAFRAWLAQWWFDTSARAMSMGHRGQTRALGISGPLWELAKSPLLPGDLAVRGDGVHVVVYLGDHQWIEADPTIGKVHCWMSKPSDGAWYEHMTLHRWVAME